MSERAENILMFIIDYRTRRGISPTYREIGKACDVSSTSLVRYYLDDLDKRGYITRLPNTSRGIVLEEKGKQQRGL